jgi:hypothetical protein
MHPGRSGHADPIPPPAQEDIAKTSAIMKGGNGRRAAGRGPGPLEAV